MEIISIADYKDSRWEKQKDHIRQVLEEELKKIHKTNRDEAEEKFLHFITLTGDVLSTPNYREHIEKKRKEWQEMMAASKE